MRLDPRFAADVHGWLMLEGRKTHSGEDLESAVDRFLKRWPRVKPDVLQYVSEMLSAELHVRTVNPAAILRAVRERIDGAPRHRWWRTRWARVFD